jgi:hypothetical protein
MAKPSLHSPKTFFRALGDETRLVKAGFYDLAKALP